MVKRKNSKEDEGVKEIISLPEEETAEIDELFGDLDSSIDD